MFVPRIYQCDEDVRVRSVVLDHPLATLITAGARDPEATQVPMILAAGTPETGSLAGATLLGHMNRSNPHWRRLRPGTRVKLVFTGPQGYVSPSVYYLPQAAPTWNFVTVHMVGEVTPLTDVDEVLDVVRRTAATYERRFGAGWNADNSVDYFRRIVDGVGGLAVRVEEVQSMFKLSQDMTPEIQERVIQAFETSRAGQHQDVARTMRSFGLGVTTGIRSILWGGAASPPCLLESIAGTATRLPTLTAVADERRAVTYQELLRWAAEITDLLAAHGVRAGSRVAVSGGRSTEVIAAILGIVALGAVYVPLDIDYPARRLEFMLRDSEPDVLLHAGPAPRLVTTAAVMPIPEPGPGRAWTPVACEPDMPVYVIYTSGSTGQPRGVAIPHSCLDNMVEWQRVHSRRPDMRTAQFAPLNFDVFFQEVLGTLAGGGTLEIVPEALRSDPFELLRWLGEHRIERSFLPYLALHMLAVAAGTQSKVDHIALAEINTAGEPLVITAPIRRFLARLTDCRLNNHYGQSESAMVTSHTLDGSSDDWPVQPPIGVPLPGCELLIDPVGEDPDVGELLVAGLPLSLGYLNDPSLNAARFVAIPPTRHGHTHAFRTGDLVCFADGVIGFLNRLDLDVKIRGTRVNLLEVDATLIDQTGIADACCVAVPTATGSRVLHAAVTVDPTSGAVDPEGWKVALREALPAASVPVSLHVLPALPMTSSGKIDRVAITEEITKRLDGHGGHV